MGSCLGTPPPSEDLSGVGGREGGSYSVAIGRNKPLKRSKLAWNADGPMTRGQLQSKRDEFWETAPVFGGKIEIWNALKAAAEAAENIDYDLAQAIVDGANVVLPRGVLSECYDELGNRYVIPDYCLSVPRNLVLEDRDDLVAPPKKDSQRRQDNDDDDDDDDDHKFPLKLRLSTGKEIRMKFKETSTIAQVKRDVAEKEDLDAGAMRLFFSGQLLVDKATIQSCKITKGYVVQVIVAQ